MKAPTKKNPEMEVYAASLSKMTEDELFAEFVKVFDLTIPSNNEVEQFKENLKTCSDDELAVLVEF